MKMTVKQAKAELKSLGIKIALIPHESEWRVNFVNGNEDSAYYTDDVWDAILTGYSMAKTRPIHNGCMIADCLKY